MSRRNNHGRSRGCWNSSGLRLTWTLEARLGGNPLKRWAGLAMETLMAEEMETGLARLKAQVEAPR